MYFWAQAFDNTGSTHCRVDGVDLSDGDTAGRRKINAVIDDVSQYGKTVFNKNSVRLQKKETEFLLHANPQERDSSDRSSPIVCYCVFAGKSNAQSVLSEIKSFASSIGRTFDQDTLDGIQQAFAKS